MTEDELRFLIARQVRPLCIIAEDIEEPERTKVRCRLAEIARLLGLDVEEEDLGKIAIMLSDRFAPFWHA